VSVNLYQSDVRTFSDEDLNRLSEELREAYYQSYTLPCECCTDEVWTDEAAAARYDEMRAEIRRRWHERHPEFAERNQLLTPAIFSRALLESLNNSLVIARKLSRDF